MAVRAFTSLTLAMIVAAGFLDGLNPCAFGTIILLVSYLTLFGLNQRTILWAGATFIAGVFISYMAIGLVFFAKSPRNVSLDQARRICRALPAGTGRVAGSRRGPGWRRRRHRLSADRQLRALLPLAGC